MGEEEEVFDIDAVSSSDSSSVSSTPARHPLHTLALTSALTPAPIRAPAGPANVPVAGQRQKTNYGPAGSKKRKQAQNVWPFTQTNEQSGRKECKFCLYVLFPLFSFFFVANSSNNC